MCKWFPTGFIRSPRLSLVPTCTERFSLCKFCHRLCHGRFLTVIAGIFTRFSWSRIIYYGNRQVCALFVFGNWSPGSLLLHLRPTRTAYATLSLQWNAYLEIWNILITLPKSSYNKNITFRSIPCCILGVASTSLDVCVYCSFVINPSVGVSRGYKKLTVFCVISVSFK